MLRRSHRGMYGSFTSSSAATPRRARILSSCRSIIRSTKPPSVCFTSAAWTGEPARGDSDADDGPSLRGSVASSSGCDTRGSFSDEPRRVPSFSAEPRRRSLLATLSAATHLSRYDADGTQNSLRACVVSTTK